MHWYLLRSKPHQENIAVFNLQQLSVEAFCPQLKQTKIMRGKKKEVISPLFPGYLFSRFDLCVEYRKVAYARGISHVVRFGTIPAVLDEETIESIRARLTQGFVTLTPLSFTPGQTVRIEGGPFHGLQAVFERELSGTQRVALLLKSVAYHARILLDRDFVVSS